MNLTELLQQAEAISPQIIDWRRHLHNNPELGMELPLTKQYVFDELRKMGYAPSFIGKAGVTALAGKKTDGKVFLLRADMDALPINEETGLPFTSCNENMHACGHDTHTAMLLGAARLLKENENQINGQVKFLFQPGEEIMEGAKDCVEAGILENPPVDAAMMIHIVSGMEAPNGLIIGFPEGPSYASCDWFRIDVKGKGGHGSTPHAAIDPIGIMVNIHQAINQYLAMNKPALEPVVATVCEFHAGSVNNVFPDDGYMAGTIRTFNEEVRNDRKAFIVDISTKLAEAKGATARVTYTRSAPSVVSNLAVSENVITTLRDMFGVPMVANAKEVFGGALSKVMGSEDFSYIAEKVPSTVLAFLSGTPSGGYKFASHNPKTDFDEAHFYKGAAAYASAALGWLLEN